MSAGSFVNSRYQATYNTAEIHPIRIQPETLALAIDFGAGAVANAAPTDALTSPISAKVSGSRRQLGLTPRKVRFEFTATPPTGYNAGDTLELPWLVNVTTIPKGATGTYLGVAIAVTGFSPENAS